MKQLLGLFVDDEYLAATIVLVVALAGALALFGAPSWLVGLILTVALPSALTASVLRTVRRARDKT